MSVTEEPWASSTPEAAGRILVKLDVPLLEALANGDAESATTICTYKLTSYLIKYRSLWNRRRGQIKEDPEDAVWVTRLVVTPETGEAVGVAGFHGKPNEDGMVEIGYGIDLPYRRQGHARAALTILLDVAAKDPRVKVVRVTVRPDNVESRSLIDKYNFVEVGEQIDEEDGLEIILEKPAR
jgi:ribosomal-protein-alanine N-acetyltransferase